MTTTAVRGSTRTPRRACSAWREPGSGKRPRKRSPAPAAALGPLPGARPEAAAQRPVHRRWPCRPAARTAGRFPAATAAQVRRACSPLRSSTGASGTTICLAVPRPPLLIAANSSRAGQAARLCNGPAAAAVSALGLPCVRSAAVLPQSRLALLQLAVQLCSLQAHLQQGPLAMAGLQAALAAAGTTAQGMMPARQRQPTPCSRC